MAQSANQDRLKDIKDKREAKLNEITYTRICLGGCGRMHKTTNRYERICPACKLSYRNVGRFAGGTNFGKLD